MIEAKHIEHTNSRYSSLEHVIRWKKKGENNKQNEENRKLFWIVCLFDIQQTTYYAV